MGLSLEGFGGGFEIRKIAFELRDLKKGKGEKKRENKRIYLFFREI